MGRHIVRTDFIFQKKKGNFILGFRGFFPHVDWLFCSVLFCFFKTGLSLFFSAFFFFFLIELFFFLMLGGFPENPPFFLRNALSLSTVGFLFGKAASYVSWFSALLNWNMFLCALRAHSFGGSTKDKTFHASFLKPISDSPLKPIQNSP